MKIRAFGTATALCLLAFSSPLTATTRGYDVLVRNHLSVPVTIQLTQYRAPGFDGKRPARFTDELKVRTKSIQIAPAGSQTVHYNDAVGGYWIQWRKVDPVLPPASGVIDLIRDKRAIEIK